MPKGQYLIYTVNGKKYEFYSNSADIKKSASFHVTEDYVFTHHGVKIQIDPTMVSTQLVIDLFYPYRYPKTRWFFFGSDTTHDSRVPASKEDVSFEAHLVGGLKEAWLVGHYDATEKYNWLATNENKLAEKSNIESGYVQVLGLETSEYGSLECIFKFTTKPFTDSKGVKVPPMKVEGRFRAVGAYHTH